MMNKAELEFYNLIIKELKGIRCELVRLNDLLERG